MKTDWIRKVVLALVIPAVIVLVWLYATTYTSIPGGILPSIPDVGQTFLEMLRSGQLKEDLFIWELDASWIPAQALKMRILLILQQ